MHCIRRRGLPPPWFVAFVCELRVMRLAAVCRLEARGCVGSAVVDPRNRAYHVLAHVEAHVLLLTLARLRAHRLRQRRHHLHALRALTRKPST